ncbi:CoA transferase family III [Actinocorallia herbida]|uniref:CoA transferase family III n=1 Tax=Actinocorallia herbida TaxID=58109 RepID=A0A3N1D5A5_9ACTN|nr:CoA transferase [Actinocorallia herbida]ROO88722.1 CoA transferase family III [Actinocorallia herbida]
MEDVGDEVGAWARSGVVALTGRNVPLVPPGTGARTAYALGRRFTEATGVAVDGGRLLSERAAYTGSGRRGSVSAGGSCRLLPCLDGWAAVSSARADDPALLGALAFAEPGEDPWTATARWLRGHTGGELDARAALLGVAAGAVARPEAPHLPEAGRPRPVAGMLVVDFSALWAGPLCAHLLGSAGARVVKVETPTRPDGARGGDAAFYGLLHAGHSSVVLDPETPGGRRALAALVAAADIVIEASRPRALARWGLDAEAAAASGKTWVSITAHGRASDRVGFGDDVAASAGLVARDPSGPVFVGDAFADPLTGLTAAVLAASEPPAGAGVLWDLSMTDVVASTLPESPTGLSPQAVSTSSGWVVETPDGPVPVAAPARRTGPTGAASASGADTASVLGSLGIALP